MYKIQIKIVCQICISILLSIFSSLEYLGYEFLGLEYLVRMMPPLSVMNVIYLSMTLSIYLSIYLFLCIFLSIILRV